MTATKTIRYAWLALGLLSALPAAGQLPALKLPEAVSAAAPGIVLPAVPEAPALPEGLAVPGSVAEALDTARAAGVAAATEALSAEVAGRVPEGLPVSAAGLLPAPVVATDAPVTVPAPVMVVAPAALQPQAPAAAEARLVIAPDPAAAAPAPVAVQAAAAAAAPAPDPVAILAPAVVPASLPAALPGIATVAPDPLPGTDTALVSGSLPTLDPLATAAPVPVVALCVNIELTNQTYPRSTVTDIQNRLRQIYQQDPGWQQSEQQNGVRLSDGYLGPVTAEWLRRFCGDFYMEQDGNDIVAELPPRLAQIAGFATQYPEEFAILTSRPFAAWMARFDAERTAFARNVFYRGSDQDLLDLLLQFQNRNLAPLRPDTIYVLREDDITALEAAWHPRLVQLLEVVVDLEFPEVELLHRAIQNKLINSLGICKADLADTSDMQQHAFTADELRQLNDGLNAMFPSRARAQGTVAACNSGHYEGFEEDYDATLRPAIDAIAAEEMPAYEHKPILWSGADCGCVPDEITTTGYGIYPYWQTTDTVQTYDFSAFSRVGYFGLSMDNRGQLEQIRAADGSRTLLDDASREEQHFMTVAREHGSKVDWMIDRDWAGYRPGNPAELPLETQFDNLRRDIVKLIDRVPAEPRVALRPLMTLGLAAQPLNGDGVTLYFRNFPTDDASRLAFETFFRSLKADLQALSDSHNRFRRVKQNLYVNFVVDQEDFTAEQGLFNSASLQQLLDLQSLGKGNLSLIERQEKIRSVIILLLSEPYYGSLDTIYTLTTEESRSVVMPMLIADYANMRTNESYGTVLDSRVKKLDYVHESFGGAAFWPMPTYDQPGYTEFNNFVSTQFAPGYTGTLWTDVLCVYRWTILGGLNAWLVAVSVLVLVAFFAYPLQCRKVPPPIEMITRPVPLLLILLPPLVVWIYLIVVDSQFPFWNATSVLFMLIIALSVHAVYLYVKHSVNASLPVIWRCTPAGARSADEGALPPRKVQVRSAPDCGKLDAP